MHVSTAVEATDPVEPERSFRRLFQASPAPFLVLAPDSPNFTIMDVNDAYLAATLTTREALVGRGLFDVFPDDPGDPEATGVSNLRASLERVLARGEADAMPVQKYAIKRPDGAFEERWWKPCNSPLLDEGSTLEAIIHHVTDVTEDRRREAALRENEMLYRQIVEGADDFAIVTMDAHGLITSWNTGAERLLGFSEAEALGRHGALFFTEEDRQAGAPDHEMARAQSDGRAVNERWHVRKDGSRFWGSGLMMRLDEEDGGYLKIFRDRTAEHQAEAALREREARLAFLDRLGAETAPLAEADAVLATTTRLLGEHLNLSVCAYADMDEDQDGFTIRGDWAAPGSTSIVGHYSLADFGKLAVKNLSAGQPLVINDNLTELAPEEAETFQNIGIAATICMPLVKQGRLTALMAIHDRVPRQWTESELSLLREVTERSWAHVERVAAIDDLRTSEARFRAALQIETVGAIYFDMDGKLTDANDAFLAMGDYSREDLEAGRLTWQKLTPDEWLEDSHRAFAELKATGRTTPYEKEYIRRDGTRWWALFAAKLLPDGTGFEFVLDITDRKQAEQRRLALVQLADRIRDTRDPDDLAYSAAEILGRALKVSRAGYGNVDTAAETIAIKRDWNAPGIESLAGVLHFRDYGSYIEDLKRGETVVFADAETDPRTAANADALKAISAQSVVNMPVTEHGGMVALLYLNHATARHWSDEELALIREVAERTRTAVERLRAEVALRESEARLRAVVDAAPVGLVFADGSGRITGANARVEEIIGAPITRSQAVDSYGSDYVAFHADGRRVEAGEYPLARVLSGEVDRAELEVQAQLPGGALRWVRYIATPMKDEDGRMIGAVVASLNIDQEKRFAENLALEVERTVAELESAQEALRQSQKMEAMGQLTGGVAHDFNNLLTPIIGSLDMLQRRGSMSDRERRLIDGALQSAEKAKTLVQRLLAFARRQPLQAQAVDVPRLVAEMAELVASTSGPHIKVKVDTEQDLPSAHADPNQLEMAILNLAVNARDAMPDGGSLTISARLDEVGDGHRSKLPRGRYVRLSVSDTGVGMDEATLARAVEPFFSTKGIGRGTGLGLSMVEGLAAQLGGALAIDSRPGLGTAIHLWLPVTDADAVADEETLHVERLASVGTALLVDDEDLVRASTAEMLGDLGYAVVEAASGEEALQLVDSGIKFELLVTDHLMPGIKGTELAATLLERFPQCAALVISGYAESDELAPHLPRLSKPFRQSELAAALAELKSNSKGANPEDRR